jgi:hypothetical protein
MGASTAGASSCSARWRAARRTTQSHVAIHTYDRFSERKAEIAVEAAETLLARVEAEFASFRATIDPD